MTTSVAGLRNIYTSNLDDTLLAGHLASATLVVNEDLRPNSSMSEDRYDLITYYLAAHFASVSELNASPDSGRLKATKMGDSTDTFVTPAAADFALSASPWGQMAISLDTSGRLSAMSANRGLPAQFRTV